MECYSVDLCIGTKHYIKRIFAARNANIRAVKAQVGVTDDEKQIQLLQAQSNCLKSLEVVLMKEFCEGELEDL